MYKVEDTLIQLAVLKLLNKHTDWSVHLYSEFINSHINAVSTLLKYHLLRGKKFVFHVQCYEHNLHVAHVSDLSDALTVVKTT